MLKSLCVCKVSIMSLKVSTSRRNSLWTEWGTIATSRINSETSMLAQHVLPLLIIMISRESSLQTLHLILRELWNAYKLFLNLPFVQLTRWDRKFLEKIQFDPVCLHSPPRKVFTKYFQVSSQLNIGIKEKVNITYKSPLDLFAWGRCW